MKNPIVTIEMENGNKMKVELYPDIAPNTVKNFVSLVKKGFYDGVIFHRVIPGFMIQGGDPQGVGTGGPGYSIKGEFAANGFDNPLKHTKGVISMARSFPAGQRGKPVFHHGGRRAPSGRQLCGVWQGDRRNRRSGPDCIGQTEFGRTKPLEDQRMAKVTVETFGEEIGEPETL